MANGCSDSHVSLVLRTHGLLTGSQLGLRGGKHHGSQWRVLVPEELQHICKCNSHSLAPSQFDAP